jgi:hypothetical protein
MAEPDPLQEASDPTTDPERLRELARQKAWAVLLAVWRNPSLPEDVWREAVFSIFPEAWDNPIAPIYLLAWTPREQDAGRTLVHAVRWTTVALWRNPERCSSEGKALLAAKVQEWWATSEESEDMMDYLGEWAKAKGDDSPEHREVVRMVVLCVRTAPDLHREDRQALDLLEAWAAGGQDLRKKAQVLASSEAVTDTVAFALQQSWRPLYAINEVIIANSVALTNQGKELQEAETENSRRLADVIRQAMPLPPVVE